MFGYQSVARHFGVGKGEGRSSHPRRGLGPRGQRQQQKLNPTTPPEPWSLICVSSVLCLVKSLQDPNRPFRAAWAQHGVIESRFTSSKEISGHFHGPYDPVAAISVLLVPQAPEMLRIGPQLPLNSVVLNFDTGLCCMAAIITTLKRKLIPCLGF